jgi:hypothetical protein
MRAAGLFPAARSDSVALWCVAAADGLGCQLAAINANPSSGLSVAVRLEIAPG